MNTDLVVVKCMKCEKVTSFVSSFYKALQLSHKHMLLDRCGACTTVFPGKVLRNNHWWGDGIPIGHNKELTLKQSKYLRT